MSEPIRISNSEIGTFKQCRRRWWLRYYRKFGTRETSYTGPLALGSRVHKALELYYNGEGDLVELHNKLVETDRLILLSEWRDTSSLDSEGELGRLMLEGYLEWNAEEGIDSDLDIISNEQKLSVPLFDGKVELMAKLDKRVRRKSDGVRLYVDYKTAADLSTLSRTAHMNEQMLTYLTIEALQHEEKERVEGGLFIVLKKVKRSVSARPPFYQLIEVRHNIFTLRSFWSRLMGTIRDMLVVRHSLDTGISHLEVAYPTPTRDCTWRCEYFAICPLFDDGSAAEQALTEMYVQSEPYSYYGEDFEKKGNE